MKTEDVKDVSYIVFESTIARFDRVIRRLWIVILVLVFLLLGTNLAWLYYESQFEETTTTTTTTQEIKQKADGDSNNSFIGGDNNVGDTDGENEDRNNKKDKA